jgi:hypothetical protein
MERDDAELAASESPGRQARYLAQIGDKVLSK